MRADVVDVAEDVITVSQKRWNPLDKWWTTAALVDRTNTPQNLGLSDSDYRLEQELRSHVPRSPMDSNASPQPSLGSTDPDNSHPLPVDPPQPAHNNLPLGIDSNTPPQPSQEPIDGSDSDFHSTGSMSPWSWYEAWAISKSPSSSPSHDSNPPPRGNLDVLQNPQGDQSSPKTSSDPGPLWQYSPGASANAIVSDPGPLRSSDSPSDSGQSTGAYASSDPDSEQSTGTSSGPDSEQSTAAYPSDLDSEQSTGAYYPSDLDSEQSTIRPDPPSDPVPSTPHPPNRGVTFFELFRGGRLKRRISGSRSVNAAQRELPDILESREYVSASAFPLPLTYQLPWS